MPVDPPISYAPESFPDGVGESVVRHSSAITESPAESRRLTFLDTLRFVAAGAVLFQHIAEKSGASGSQAAAMLSPGVFGVVLFFVVSGFVIPMTAGRRFDLKTFAIRRIARVYPLVLVAFALLAWLGYGTDLAAFAEVKAATVRTWLANLLLVQDYVGATPLLGVTWTLSIEFAWYAIFAVAYLKFGWRFHDKLVIIAPVLLLGLCAVSMASGHRLPIARIGMVYAAILGCRIFHAHGGGLSARRLSIDTLVFIAVMAISNLISFGYYRHPNITLYQALIPWLLAPLLFVLVACVPSIRHSRLVSHRMTAWLGSVSFSTYLLHPFAMGLANAYAPHRFFAVTSVLLTLVLSVLGYRLVELPGQALGKQIIASIRKSVAT